MEKFIQEITKRAGKAVLDQFGKIGVEYTKRDVTEVVTKADLLSNKILTESIKTKYPNHGIISEEEKDHQASSRNLWIIDPLDGTRNFSTRIPLFAVMTAFVQDQKVVLASIYDPCQDELFFAQKGKGAYLNGKRIHCSEKREWEHSWGCAGGNLRPAQARFLKNLIEAAKKESFWVSIFGATAISAIYVADGRRDWYYSGENFVWDYAAPSLVLAEAGCIVTNSKGEPWTLEDRNLAAANKFLHPKLIKIINK